MPRKMTYLEIKEHQEFMDWNSATFAIKRLNVKKFKEYAEKMSAPDYTNKSAKDAYMKLGFTEQEYIEHDGLFTLFLVECIDVITDIHSTNGGFDKYEYIFNNILTPDEYMNIHRKIMNSLVEILDIILQRPNINIDIKDKHNQHILTRLHHDDRYYSIFKRLLAYPKIEFNTIADQNSPLLHSVAEYCSDKIYYDEECDKYLHANIDEVSIFTLLYNHPKIDINIQDKMGYTVIMYYVNETRDSGVDMFNKLLKHPNININIQNYFGKTILMQSMLNHLEESSEIQLQCALDGKYKWSHDHQDRMVRHGMKRKYEEGGDFENFDIRDFHTILERPELDINLQDKDGNTAIMLSIINRKFEPIFFIDMINSKHGKTIDFNLKNKDGKDVLQLISEMKDKIYQEKFVKLLKV